MFVLLVLMFMLISWVFSLAYASVCAYAYAYALVKTSLKFSFHGKPFKLSWRWRDFPGPITILLLRIATNEIASFSF